MNDLQKVCAAYAAARNGEAKARARMATRPIRLRNLSERLAEWNGLADEFADLWKACRTEPRTAATMRGACLAWNAVHWRRTSMAWALAADRPDKAERHARNLHRQVELLREALDRNSGLNDRRGDIEVEAPDIRLPDTIEEVRALHLIVEVGPSKRQ